MADDETQRGPPDNKRLNKGEPYEVAARKARIDAALLDEADIELEAGPPTMPESVASMAASAESAGILGCITDSLFSARTP